MTCQELSSLDQLALLTFLRQIISKASQIHLSDILKQTEILRVLFFLLQIEYEDEFNYMILEAVWLFINLFTGKDADIEIILGLVRNPAQ